ncbi:hypothetical protein VL73_36 [Erwinia phage VL73]
MAVAAPVAAFMAANAGTIAAVSAVASVASTGYSMYAQSQAAKAEASAQERQNTEIAKQAAASYDDLSPAEIDANNQANALSIQQQADAIGAKGRVNVFAAASGTLGGSVDSMIYDTEAMRSRNINSILDQRESGLYSIKQQAESVRQGAINNQSTRAISSPSWLENGLKLGSAVVQGFDNYGRMKDTFSLQDKATTGVRGGV